MITGMMVGQAGRHGGGALNRAGRGPARSRHRRSPPGAESAVRAPRFRARARQRGRERRAPCAAPRARLTGVVEEAAVIDALSGKLMEGPGPTRCASWRTTLPAPAMWPGRSRHADCLPWWCLAGPTSQIPTPGSWLPMPTYVTRILVDGRRASWSPSPVGVRAEQRRDAEGRLGAAWRYRGLPALPGRDPLLCVPVAPCWRRPSPSAGARSNAGGSTWTSGMKIRTAPSCAR